MTKTLAVASFRRVTPAIVASARLAMANDVPDTSKSEVAILLKKAAPVLGIDGTTYHVMDILIGLSRPDDWHGDGRPIVAISNAKLAEYTMRSRRTVIRCLRQLVEAGIAAYRDSSSGRRYVYRDKKGAIETGFGIDFTPARVRLAELKAAVERYQQRLRAESAARRDIVRLSRAIKDLCGAFPHRRDQWLDELAVATTGPADEITRAERIRDVYNACTAVIDSGCVEDKMSCKGDISVTSNTNTTRETSLDRNQRPRSTERINLNKRRLRRRRGSRKRAWWNPQRKPNNKCATGNEESNGYPARGAGPSVAWAAGSSLPGGADIYRGQVRNLGRCRPSWGDVAAYDRSLRRRLAGWYFPRRTACRERHRSDRAGEIAS